MASYKYEVVGADGKPKTGTIEAMNMEVASAELKSGGNTIVSIARANAFNKDLEIHIGKAVSVREMSVFCRQFESVLNAGVTVVEALDMLSEQTENKPFANAIAEVRDSVQRGETLAVAMAEHPKIFRTSWCRWLPPGNPPVDWIKHSAVWEASLKKKPT